MDTDNDNDDAATADDRHMNDSTLPPSQPIISTTIAKPADTTTIKTTRRKVIQQKGFALHDWMHLVKHANDLSRRKGAPIRPISKSEIARHNNVHDGWVSLRGKVYNLTPYLHYHPGGVHILEHVLGNDADQLFDKYHRWVNIDGLIGTLQIGYLASQSEETEDKKETSTNDFTFAVPAPRPPGKGTLPSLLLSNNKLDDNQDESNSDKEDDSNPWEK